jgi:hypothetical protein
MSIKILSLLVIHMFWGHSSNGVMSMLLRASVQIKEGFVLHKLVTGNVESLGFQTCSVCSLTYERNTLSGDLTRDLKLP